MTSIIKVLTATPPQAHKEASSSSSHKWSCRRICDGERCKDDAKSRPACTDRLTAAVRSLLRQNGRKHVHLHRQTIPMHIAMFLFFKFCFLYFSEQLFHIHLIFFVIFRVENPCCVRATFYWQYSRYCNFCGPWVLRVESFSCYVNQCKWIIFLWVHVVDPSRYSLVYMLIRCWFLKIDICVGIKYKRADSMECMSGSCNILFVYSPTCLDCDMFNVNVEYHVMVPKYKNKSS